MRSGLSGAESKAMPMAVVIGVGYRGWDVDQDEFYVYNCVRFLKVAGEARIFILYISRALCLKSALDASSSLTVLYYVEMHASIFDSLQCSISIRYS